MKLTKNHISELRNQLYAQIKHLPTEQRKEAEKQIEEMSDEAIEEKLNAKKTNIILEHKFGESIINIIPIYDKDLSLESERMNSHEDQLDKITEELKKKEEIKIKKEERPALKKMPRRIP